MQTFWIACSYSLSMFPLHESAPTTTGPKEHGTEMTYVTKFEMYVTSSILSLTGLLCFKCVSKPCTQMNDLAEEFLLQLNEMAYAGQI